MAQSEEDKAASRRLIEEALRNYGGGGDDQEEEEEEGEEGRGEEEEESATQPDPGAPTEEDGTQAAAPARKRHAPHQIEIELRKINAHIVCKLCAGYFINATTIMECLHTFCKSCIVTYFQTNKTCPTCGILVHETNPIEMLRLDRTVQAIVYKIVDGLQEEEQKREEEYYASLGVPHPDQADRRRSQTEEAEPAAKRPKIEANTVDDQISFCLVMEEDSEANETNEKVTSLEKPFIRTSARATILHLKKFLAKKLSLPRPEDVDILCRGEVLGKEYSLEYISKTRWRKGDQLVLNYRPKIDFEAP